ncbi:efflux RND transporter periplasmic adaptor subunit [Myxosarcina sp. GI1]|uniref:efflux RND transporter periplasmic adaptor subunit n=1 Tax=Myxosarcina sp. GI1 TaxID=1541065 RepID=UPI00068A5930|nr:efflux RND transporter periplasmic adaptor subunit [Myxosarcina sp. GI1]
MQSNSSNHSPKSPEIDRSQVIDKQIKPDHTETNGKSPKPKPKQPWQILLGLIVLLLLGYGGWRWWQTSQADTSPPAAQSQPQAAPVGLKTLQSSTVRETSQFIGSLTSPQSVNISPEIEGRVSQIYVEEGSEVAAGQPLVQLRPDRQTAELSSLQAALNSAQAARANAQAQLQSVQSERSAAAAEVELQKEQTRRRQFLVDEGALAQEELDLANRDRLAAVAQLNSLDDQIQAARANLSQAEAAVEEARANVAVARDELQYTNIVAPFAGEVGDIIVKLGAYVAPGTTLTSVTKNDPLELELAIPIERRSDLQRGLPVELEDTQGNSFGEGRITFISPQVNANSQTILTQAQFPNPDGQLRDSQDVRARIVWEERQGILVPTTAVTRVGGQAFVYVAREPEPQADSGAEASEQPQLVARQVPVELGELQNNNYPVLEGLQSGDRIVVTGILNLADGAPIKQQAEDQLQIQ